MWADNSYWLPQVRILGQRWPVFDTFFPVQAIGGNRVRGYFLYSGLSQIQDHHVEFLWPGSAIGIFSRLFWTNHDVSDERGEMAVIDCSFKKFFWGIFWPSVGFSWFLWVVCGYYPDVLNANRPQLLKYRCIKNFSLEMIFYRFAWYGQWVPSKYCSTQNMKLLTPEMSKLE